MLAVTSVIFPVLVGLAVVAPDAVPLVLGEKWSHLVVPLQVLCAVGLFRSFMDTSLTFCWPWASRCRFWVFA